MQTGEIQQTRCAGHIICPRCANHFKGSYKLGFFLVKCPHCNASLAVTTLVEFQAEMLRSDTK